MLNYIWLSLIVVGVGVAVVGDLRDLSGGKYRNGDERTIFVEFPTPPSIPLEKSKHFPCTVRQPNGSSQSAEIIPVDETSGVLHVFMNDNAPDAWTYFYKAQRNPDFLLVRAQWSYSSVPYLTVQARIDPVKFVNLSAVTNDGIIKYAKSAVELAIGLIGIMALWLGIMKIADEAGLVAKLARVLKPVTTRLFPDVPPDHPAMGAMIMNISANMLGLSNAATPLGLKAMEELNKLNKKAGTATDAMCTFLVINTSNVQLIPATVIAIRAAAGSANPTEILGPVLLATAISLVVGISTVKLLARLPVYRRSLEAPE
jgi:spore maturation protein A